VRLKYFEISHPVESGETAYITAAKETYLHEGKSLCLEHFVIRNGDYIGIDVADYETDPGIIGSTFDILLNYPEIDPKGCWS
jgi:hypothetical protein